MAQAALPVLNMIILGSFMAYGAVQIRYAQAALTKVEIDADK
jgi:hypothetical protein